MRNNVEHHGILYTPVADLEEFGDVTRLIPSYNGKLYYKHTERQLVQDKDHVFIRGYENDTVAIVEKLQEHASSGIDGYTAAVEWWLDEAPRGIDDEVKKDALKLLFSQSNVALIYGAAGTGKSTMVDHIAQLLQRQVEALPRAHQPGDRQPQAQGHRAGLDLPDDQQPDPPDRLRSGVRPPGHRRVQHGQQR